MKKNKIIFLLIIIFLPTKSMEQPEISNSEIIRGDELKMYKEGFYAYSRLLTIINRNLKGNPLAKDNAFFLTFPLELACDRYCLNLGLRGEASLEEINNFLRQIQQCTTDKIQQLKEKKIKINNQDRATIMELVKTISTISATAAIKQKQDLTGTILQRIADTNAALSRPQNQDQHVFKIPQPVNAPRPNTLLELIEDFLS